MAGIGRNGWPEWSGMSGRDRAEYAADEGLKWTPYLIEAFSNDQFSLKLLALSWETYGAAICLGAYLAAASITPSRSFLVKQAVHVAMMSGTQNMRTLPTEKANCLVRLFQITESSNSAC